MPFEPLTPAEPATHMLLEVNEVFIPPNIAKCVHTYATLHVLPTGQTNDDMKLSLKNASHVDILQLEQNLMSLPQLSSEK